MENRQQFTSDQIKIRQKIYQLLKDAVQRRINPEMFIDAFVPLFATYGPEIFSEQETEILDDIFQEAPYFVPVVFIKPSDYVFLDIRKFRKLLETSWRNLLATGAMEFARKQIP